MLTIGIDGGCRAGASWECRDIEQEEPHNRVVITEEVDTSNAVGPNASDFARRHPVASYLFGDMIRGFYVIGCLGLDLFTPVQVRLWFPGMDALVLPPVVAAILALAYGELRLYRRLWPRTRELRVVKDRRIWR